MATHSSILAWRIPWTEEPGRLESMGFQRVGQDQSDLAYTQSLVLTSHVALGKSLNPLYFDFLISKREIIIESISKVTVKIKLVNICEAFKTVTGTE